MTIFLFRKLSSDKIWCSVYVVREILCTKMIEIIGTSRHKKRTEEPLKKMVQKKISLSRFM